MSTDHTEQQSTEEQKRARDLSLQAARPPQEVPGYTIQQLLGCGAYGEVWIGVDRNTSRRVAIKFYTHRSGVDWTQLSREVEKLVYLSADRYVVQLLDVGWDADPPYYVMDYIENGSLEELLCEHGSLPVAQATELIGEVAIGLMHAHGKGVLHCDLKPANILLDQDLKPRLADFGQSRLSNEQSPALGTLFYMAPEQADLKALPDARWDVYALGAIFYRLVMGEPPFRSEAAVRRIEEVKDLRERLGRYRAIIRSAPTPTDHRRVPGVDRPLADIMDRCLAVNPEQRFANVQAVLDALNARAERKLRRPLVLLGFVGPVLLMLIMALFALRGYDHAVRDSEYVIGLRARESNEFAAKLAAGSIEGEIEGYFNLIGQEAAAEELRRRLLIIAKSDTVRQLNDPKNAVQDIERLRSGFLAEPPRRALNDYLRKRLFYHLEQLDADPAGPKFASMFVLDARGRMLAVAYDNQETPTRSVGWNFAFRSYFHGGPSDLDDYGKADLPEHVQPIRDAHLSAAFLSTSTGTWKVAISTPIRAPGQPAGEVAGVLAMTLSLGDFAYFRSNRQPDRFAVLIDGRPGLNRGVILQHPLFDAMRRHGSAFSQPNGAARYRVTEQQLRRVRTDKWHPYQDPMQRASGGEPYGGDWIAALEYVRLPRGPTDRRDMIVLVQERYDKATEPVKWLGSRLKREGLWAIAGVTSVVLVLWYIVLRMLQEPRIVLRRAQPTPTPPTPAHNLTTLPAPRGAEGEGKG